MIQPHPLHLFSPFPCPDPPPLLTYIHTYVQTYMYNSILYITHYTEDTDNHKIVSTNRRIVYTIILCGPISKENKHSALITLQELNILKLSVFFNFDNFVCLPPYNTPSLKCISYWPDLPSYEGVTHVQCWTLKYWVTDANGNLSEQGKVFTEVCCSKIRYWPLAQLLDIRLQHVSDIV